MLIKLAGIYTECNSRLKRVRRERYRVNWDHLQEDVKGRCCIHKTLRRLVRAARPENVTRKFESSDKPRPRLVGSSVIVRFYYTI